MDNNTILNVERALFVGDPDADVPESLAVSFQQVQLDTVDGSPLAGETPVGDTSTLRRFFIEDEGVSLHTLVWTLLLTDVGDLVPGVVLNDDAFHFEKGEDTQLPVKIFRVDVELVANFNQHQDTPLHHRG